MTPEQAADLAARTLTVIGELDGDPSGADLRAADRERVASDLAPFTLDAEPYGEGAAILRAWREAAATNLLRTAALYGVPDDDMDAAYERIVQAGRDLGHDL